MNRIWLIALISIFASTGSGQELRELIREAAKASGREYIAARTRIVEMGERIMPELEAVLADESNDWRERAMAGIAIEWIQKGDRIRALINYDWRNHPDLKDDPGWESRAGRPRNFYNVLKQKLEQSDFDYYYLELAWKETGESPRVGTSGHIHGAGHAEVVGNAFLIHLAREKVMSMPVAEVRPWMIRDWYVLYLLRIRDRESLPHLFDIWLNLRPILLVGYLRNHRESNAHRSDQDIQRFAERDTDQMLRPLLEMAGSEDKAWILERLNGVPLGEYGNRYQESYLRRCRGLPEPEREPIDETQMGESQRQFREMLRRRAAERAQQEQALDPESQNDAVE